MPGRITPRQASEQARAAARQRLREAREADLRGLPGPTIRGDIRNAREVPVVPLLCRHHPVCPMGIQFDRPV